MYFWLSCLGFEFRCDMSRVFPAGWLCNGNWQYRLSFSMHFLLRSSTLRPDATQKTIVC